MSGGPPCRQNQATKGGAPRAKRDACKWYWLSLKWKRWKGAASAVPKPTAETGLQPRLTAAEAADNGPLFRRAEARRFHRFNFKLSQYSASC